MYVIIAAALLGFALGGLLTLICQQHARRKERERMRAKIESLRAQCESLRKSESRWKQTAQLKQSSSVPAVSPSEPGKQQEKAMPKPREKQPQKRFESVQDLELVFQYAAPEGLYLRPGKGFLRNECDELVPDAQTFQMPNTTIGFAMGGMFYLYDVAYGGKIYGFQQILDRELGSGYVWLKRVHQPAVIRKIAGSDSYTLSRKGLIEVEDAS